MRVCDRHPRKQATQKIIIEIEDQHIDLCEECLNLILDFVRDTKIQTPNPKKRKRLKWRNGASPETVQHAPEE